MKKILIFLVLALIALVAPSAAKAQTSDVPVDEWVINDFKSDIVVNKDSSLTITEWITADCGDCINRHGIFRVLPQKYTLKNSQGKNQTYKTPVTLQSITDFNEVPYQYSTSGGWLGGALTWNIGDPNETVTGINQYKIVYTVKNAFLGADQRFDELYWNINGFDWDLYIKHSSATITFPTAIEKKSNVSLYSGERGDRGNPLGATSTWTAPNILMIETKNIIPPNQGVTVSATLPKGIVAVPPPTFADRYGDYFYLLIPLVVFTVMFLLWRRYGKDPKIHAAIVPEFAVPDNLTPMEMSAVMGWGSIAKVAYSAEIVSLAVRGYITITEIPQQGVFKKTDYLLTKKKAGVELNAGDIKLLNSLFENKNEVKLSDLAHKFYAHIPHLEETVDKQLHAKNLVGMATTQMQFVSIFGIGFFFFIYLIFVFTIFSFQVPILTISIILAGIIIMIFLFLMPRRSVENVQMLYRIKGFQMYMETAEKYRQQFNEKENIFEKWLPYAILFGMTGLWAKKMQQIYGQEYMNNYHPLWYGGYMGTFNADSFSGSMQSIVSAVNSASAAPLNSGSGTSGGGFGGGGFAGGGGGGGGGGGW